MQTLIPANISEFTVATMVSMISVDHLIPVDYHGYYIPELISLYFTIRGNHAINL